MSKSIEITEPCVFVDWFNQLWFLEHIEADDKGRITLVDPYDIQKDWIMSKDILLEDINTEGGLFKFAWTQRESQAWK